MTPIQQSEHNAIQVEIIRSSIAHLHLSLDLAKTGKEDYWKKQVKVLNLKLKTEERHLQDYKESDPELFI
jgi:hypothetical protein